MVFLFFSIWFLFFGFIIGSFLNVVVLRFNTGKNLQGRSSCYSCQNYLRWFELVPVFSWLIQKGRCRHCSSKISSQYIKGELLTGLLFLLAALRGMDSGIDIFSLGYLLGTIYLCITFSILVVIFLYDLKHKIIPDTLSIAFGVLGVIAMLFFSFENGIFIYHGFIVPEITQWFAPLLVPLPFFFLWLLSRGRFMGLGDPKLMVGMGAFLGLSLGFSSVFMSFWIGTAYLLLVWLYHTVRHDNVLVNETKKSIMKMEIPFGPFLVAGFVVSVISMINIFAL